VRAQLGALQKGEIAMKALWTLRTIFTVAALAVGSFPLAATAQTHDLKVNVPFGFEVGSQHLAPGVYTVSTPLTDVVEFRSESGSAMLLTHGGENYKGTKSAKIVFKRYGDHYFLHEVWFSPSDTTYMECTQSKAEKRAKAEELAANQTKSADVEVAVVHFPQ
jgi:hypothetical protein